MKKMEKPRKPLIFYYAIVLVVMILLNTLLFPRLMGQEVTQVDLRHLPDHAGGQEGGCGPGGAGYDLLHRHRRDPRRLCHSRL